MNTREMVFLAIVMVLLVTATLEYAPPTMLSAREHLVCLVFIRQVYRVIHYQTELYFLRFVSKEMCRKFTVSVGQNFLQFRENVHEFLPYTAHI